MAKIIWDAIGEHLYETGTDHGVLYPTFAGSATGQGYTGGVAWNGLTGFTDKPSGAEATKIFADNIKYLTLRSAEDYGATVTAFTYPPEFGECNGEKLGTTGVHVKQQARKAFGFVCRTLVGNDVDGDDYGEKLHLIYGATASPSEKSYKTVNDSPEAIEFSWDFDTVPVEVGDGFRPTACLEIDTTELTGGKENQKYKDLCDVLFGTDGSGNTEGTAPRLPMPAEVISMMT